MRYFALVAILGLAALAPASEAPAQVVQLPTYHQFSISTSVLVPDRGAAYLGGVNSAAYGSSRRGPFQRSLGSSVGAAGVSVQATIIDHAELDRAVLAEAAARRKAGGEHAGRLGETAAEEAIRRKAAFLSQHVGRPVQRR